jgi:transcriptional regulator with PAS, ATPase and Fis domain
MSRIFEILPPVAASPTTVLLLGETGTGKEVLARTIHSLSPRAAKPFVAVNCSALPDTLLESELFGYKAGAFTGAAKDKPGRFSAAEGGTIFLDEIGDVSPSVQAKLLRVLQERTYEPLGSNVQKRADIRIIAATNRNLAAEVKAGRFRDDLYYRLNVVKVELPPLRQRREDIPQLIGLFVQRFNETYARDIEGPSPEALSLLIAYDWPGNVRELENAIESAFVVCQGYFIDIPHLPREIVAHSVGKVGSDMGSSLRLLEREVLLSALERNNWNRAAAAKELGIHRTTFFRKIRKLDVTLPDEDGRSRGR